LSPRITIIWIRLADVRAGCTKGIASGADDNASGVACMLELARLMAECAAGTQCHLSAFAGEEAGPWARVLCQCGATPGTAFALSGHIAKPEIDTVGRLADGKVTVSDRAARELPFIFMVRAQWTGVPTPIVGGVNAMDQRRLSKPGFRRAGVCVTASDYHRRRTPLQDRSCGMAKVAAILKEAIDYLAARPEPLIIQAVRPQRRRAARRRQISPPGCHRHVPDMDRPGRRRTRKQRAAGIRPRKTRAQTR